MKTGNSHSASACCRPGLASAGPRAWGRMYLRETRGSQARVHIRPAFYQLRALGQVKCPLSLSTSSLNKDISSSHCQGSSRRRKAFMGSREGMGGCSQALSQQELQLGALARSGPGGPALAPL